MSDAHTSFGQQMLAASTPAARFLLDQSEAGRRAKFRALDQDLAELVSASLAGGMVVEETRGPELKTLVAPTLATAHGELLTVEQQEAHGLWTHPVSARIPYGQMHGGFWLKKQPKYAATHAWAQSIELTLKDSPLNVALWGLFSVFDELWLPIKLRTGNWLGNRTEALQLKTWATIDPLYAALGIEPAALEPFRFGQRWHDLSSDTITGYRVALGQAWADAAQDAGERYRVFRTAQLVERYYKKAKNGRALRAKVLDKPTTRTLITYFGGSWLAFLEYLGEQPHDEEALVGELAPTKFLTDTAGKTGAVAEAEGVSEGDVAAILSSLWGTDSAASPVERRTAVLMEWWAEVDHLHAVQAPGMESLWGLVSEQDSAFLTDPDQDGPDFAPMRAVSLLSSELRERVVAEFGTVQHPKALGKLVSRQTPTYAVAEALGAAAKLWHGVALTAWFLTQGPYSRTDLGGMPDYYRDELRLLSEAGCPAPKELFDDLLAAAARDGDPEHGGDNHLGLEITIEVGHDDDGNVSVETRDGESSRRSGGRQVTFQTLRDIITRHRRAWATEHMESWVRHRWQQDLSEVNDQYLRRVADKGKPPTDRQMTTMALKAANLWFGGDVAALCSTLTIPGPPHPTPTTSLMPVNIARFKYQVQQALMKESTGFAGEEAWQTAEHRKHAGCRWLADRAPVVVQLTEADIEGGPQPQHLSRAGYTDAIEGMAPQVEDPWAWYLQVVADCRVEDDPLPGRAKPPVEPIPATDGQAGAQPALEGAAPRLAAQTSVPGPDEHATDGGPLKGRLGRLFGRK